MKFLNYGREDGPLELRRKFDAYFDYVENNKQLMPTEAYQFVTADWHYDPTDPRCPHDSWLESLRILESPGENNGNLRKTRIKLILLGAYHDGHIEIEYQGVRGYSFGLNPHGGDQRHARHHGDWIIDEICLTGDKWLIHEIEFRNDANWQIECDNIFYRWLPFKERH